MNGPVRSCWRKARPPCPTRNCWQSCCGRVYPAGRRSTWRATWSELSLAAQAAGGRPAEILQRAGPRVGALCRIAGRGRTREEATVGDPARRTFAGFARATRDFLSSELRDLEHEVFCCLYLDKRHRLIQFQKLFRGTIDGASVHPREIVKLALQHNSAAVIIAHNHPSGIAEPSQADEMITQRVKEALGLVDIRLLDHIVIGDGVSVSLAERGLI